MEQNLKLQTELQWVLKAVLFQGECSF